MTITTKDLELIVTKTGRVLPIPTDYKMSEIFGFYVEKEIEKCVLMLVAMDYLEKEDLWTHLEFSKIVPHPN